MNSLRVKVVRWSDVSRWCRRLAKSIRRSGYNADLIIAISRGGLVPSRILADLLDIKVILSLKIDHWVETAEHTEHAVVRYDLCNDLRGKRALVVDDITDTGESIDLAKRYTKERLNASDVKTATMQLLSSSKIKPDFYGVYVDQWAWFIYPWNYYEDTRNLLDKLKIDYRSLDYKRVEQLFIESYSIKPPVSIKKIIENEI
ncbi:MAG: xanthine phosphoribosyltransferase [Candidatus Micrarchaeota archaeon]|nr:MAG: xanthine phosphoribosyltransferase [Candidatus Micrarchaeota archaeon]